MSGVATRGEEPVDRVFTAALRGHRCHVTGLDDGPSPLPVAQWLSPADESDRALLAHCAGRTLDIGCGPGRMSEALQAQGHDVLAIDVVGEAVALARERGIPAVLRDVFRPVAGEGRWDTALLADGNIGIGGDPVALLTRVRRLLAPDGRAVVDLDEPGCGVATRWGRLRTADHRSRPFRWTIVAADAITPIAEASGFDGCETLEHDGRWFAVLRSRP